MEQQTEAPTVDVPSGRSVPQRGRKVRDQRVYRTGMFNVAVTADKRWAYVEVRDPDGKRLIIVSVVQGVTRQHIRQAEQQANAVAVALADAAGPGALAFVDRMAAARQSRIDAIDATRDHGVLDDEAAEEAYDLSLERAALTKTRALIRREIARRNDPR
ncbi:MAG: hypothetical protein OXK74_02175 [Gemmatimonadota bacterium]|nr:hypothetical protein [Gemmatimonadota bacterium]